MDCEEDNHPKFLHKSTISTHGPCIILNCMFAAKSVQKMLSSSLIAPQDRQEVILVSVFTVMTLVGEDANGRLY